MHHPSLAARLHTAFAVLAALLWGLIELVALSRSRWFRPKT